MNEVLELLKEIRPESDFAQSKDFLNDGLLDSFDVVTLVAALDNKYNISIEGIEIIPENFSNIEQISALLIKHGVKF
jgi:acyl carrier protein